MRIGRRHPFPNSGGCNRSIPLAVILFISLNVPALPAAAGGVGAGVASAVRIFFQDAWTMVSSPARLGPTGWLQTAGVLAVGGVIYAYDEEILDAFQRSRGDHAYDALLWIGRQWEPVGNMGNTNKYYVGALAVGLVSNVEPLKVIPAQILQSHLTTGGIRNTAKLLIGRRRPFKEQGAYAFEPAKGTSFPSGHASVVFELAGILSHHAHQSTLGPVLGVPIWTGTHYVATSVALQRIESRNHWPSDVYLAAVMGALTSRTVTRRWDERAEARSANVSMTPVLGRGAGLGLRIDARF